MIATAQPAKKVWTEADLEALPDNGYNHELVNGELAMSPKNNFEHGIICTRLLSAMETHNRTHRLGVILNSSTGFWMHNRNCRAPDISFIARARLSGWSPSNQNFFRGAPDLAVEILAPSNTRREIDERLKDFFTSGTQMAWVINPDEKCVEVCHSLERRELIGPDGFLDGERLLPGLRHPLADLFAGWDW